jgi:DNA-binding transcriptional regulator YiaG
MTASNETEALIKQAEALEPPFSTDDLKLIRKSFDASQAEFSNILGVPASSLKKWEQGGRGLDASTTSLYLMLIHIRKKQYFPCVLDWIGQGRKDKKTY